jgi:hypothetical protein
VGGSLGGSGPGAAGGSVGGSGSGGSGGGSGGSSGCSATTCAPPFVCTTGGSCVCSENTFQACARAGVACGYINNNCGQQVFCSCALPSQICDPETYTCFGSCVTGTAGIITTENADIICPPPPAAE